MSDQSWTAEVAMSSGPNEMININAKVVADSKDTALTAAHKILELIASGKETYVRIHPDADSYYDEQTKAMVHKGLVRFSVIDRPGERRDSIYMMKRLSPAA